MAIELINDGSSISDSVSGTAATIGVYDGVHLGHCQLLSDLRGKAKEEGLATVVVTFDQHPTKVTSPENAPKLLTSFDKKIELFQSQGIDYVYVVRFDKERSMTPAADFFESVFLEGVKAKIIMVGEDFQFGHKRAGNVAFLKDQGEKAGVETIGLELVKTSSTSDMVISSTAIRGLISDGEVRRAAGMLGRNFQIQGTVVKGDQRGQQIGFPTANIVVSEEMILPGDGVYACWYEREDNSRYMAAVNIGRRPTFMTDEKESVLEAHLLSFDADIYGEVGHVEFVDFLRNERQFDSIESLREQLEADVLTTQSLLSRN